MTPSRILWTISLATLGYAINTTPASVTVVGQLTNPGINRDSCNSVAFGSLGILWTCRDTQPVVNNAPALPVVVNTASWSSATVTSSNALTLNTPPLSQPYYPLTSNECGSNVAGECGNSTRWVGWPNTGPMVVYNYDNAVSAYAWIAKQNINNDFTVLNNVYYSLYHLAYFSSSGETLPSVSLDYDVWWGPNDIGYGSYDTLVYQSYGYLFGQTPSGDMALARINLAEPLTAVENLANYQYWVNGAWTTTKPNKNASGLAISNMYAGGQGKFYWSPHWNSFVWVGGSIYPGCTFYITTAPALTGPWTSYPAFYNNCNNGNGALGAYSLLPHPDLTSGDGTDLYISWTITVNGLYENVLAHVVWQ